MSSRVEKMFTSAFHSGRRSSTYNLICMSPNPTNNVTEYAIYPYLNISSVRLLCCNFPDLHIHHSCVCCSSSVFSSTTAWAFSGYAAHNFIPHHSFQQDCSCLCLLQKKPVTYSKPYIITPSAWGSSWSQQLCARWSDGDNFHSTTVIMAEHVFL